MRTLTARVFSGTKSDKEGTVNFDSFLVPLLEELRQLATKGVDPYQYVEGVEGLQSFRLRAHLITVTGDMPAIAKVRWRRFWRKR